MFLWSDRVSAIIDYRYGKVVCFLGCGCIHYDRLIINSSGMTLLSNGVFDVGVITSAILLISEFATSSVMLLLLIGGFDFRAAAYTGLA